MEKFGRTRRHVSKLQSSPRVRPRVSLLINDNQCVRYLFPSRLTGNNQQPPVVTQTINSHLTVKPRVASCVHSAPGHSQKKEVPGQQVVMAKKEN